MAKAKGAGIAERVVTKVSRPGVHAKTKTSKSKTMGSTSLVYEIVL